MRRPKRSLSQNFLLDPNLQRKIVAALRPAAGDHVLEIGPGTGALTRHLAGRVEKLVLIELDDELAAALETEYRGRDDVEVIHADVLDVDLSGVDGGGPIKAIGNIPYGITSPLIFHLLDRSPRPVDIVLTVQREVAARLLAQPGTKEYGALTVGVRSIADVERLFNISRSAFRPRPDVASTVVRITPIHPLPLSAQEETALRTLTRAAFSRRRKQLQKVLRQAPEFALSIEEIIRRLESLDIDPTLRPDALSVSAYVRLSALLG